MERIVYLLGAGFSAPLGLPVMSNFLFRSKDLFASGHSKFDYFRDVFSTIRDLSISQGYYDTDVFNIEDILSILEMNDYLSGKKFKDKFKRFIVDVIESSTPSIVPYSGPMPGNWDAVVFGKSRNWIPYIHFVCALMGRFLVPRNPHRPVSAFDELWFPPRTDMKEDYSVVTLNYDKVLENSVGFVNDTLCLHSSERAEFVSSVPESFGFVTLAKLHGCVSDGKIVPPTWSKGVVKDVVPAWKLAYEVLSEATQIRILGYSLPTSDAYVKYLLKSAVIQQQNLKKIDVICMDPTGEVKQRFDSFIKFRYYRFANANVFSYLKSHGNHYAKPVGGIPLFDRLEESHAEFMDEAALK